MVIFLLEKRRIPPSLASQTAFSGSVLQIVFSNASFESLAKIYNTMHLLIFQLTHVTACRATKQKDFGGIGMLVCLS